MILQQIGVDWTLLNNFDGTSDTTSNSTSGPTYDVLLLPPNESNRQWVEAAHTIPTIDFSGLIAKDQGSRSFSQTVKHLLDTPWLQPIWDVPIHPMTVRAFPKGQGLQKSIWVDEPCKVCHIGLPFWSQAEVHASWMATMPMEASIDQTSNRPSERIHKTPYALMRHVLHYVLIQCCLWSGRPLVRKATLPEGVESVMMFRVDSDYGTKDAVQSLIRTCQTYGIPATWFLHTEAHKGWLDRFVDPNIEMAVHGARHQSRGSTEALLRNIRQARDDIKQETGQNPTGVAMPFGRYTSQIADVYRQSNHLFDYASDFGFDSDNLPHWPSDNQPLQVPIHPICPGSFRRTNATEQDIQRYFLGKWARSIARDEPFIFYHHPMQSDAGVLNQLFGEVAELRSKGQLETWTMQQWASWWVRRSMSNPHDKVVDNNLEGDTKIRDVDPPMRVKWIEEDTIPKPLSGQNHSIGTYSPPKRPFKQWKAMILDELGQRTQ
jgi:hypothetical protein